MMRGQLLGMVRHRAFLMKMIIIMIIMIMIMIVIHI